MATCIRFYGSSPTLVDFSTLLFFYFIFYFLQITPGKTPSLFLLSIIYDPLLWALGELRFIVSVDLITWFLNRLNICVRGLDIG